MFSHNNVLMFLKDKENERSGFVHWKIKFSLNKNLTVAYFEENPGDFRLLPFFFLKKSLGL